MSFSQKRYLVYSYAPESSDDYLRDVALFDRLSEAVEQAQSWVKEPANPNVDKGEKLKIAIYKLVEVVKDDEPPFLGE